MSEGSVLIEVATEYSAYPAGRDAGDGPFNGEKFRNELLIPRFTEARRLGTLLIVSFDGVRSFGSSFLEEAFGGLVRAGFSKKDINRTLQIRLTAQGSTRYLEAISRYIERA